MKYCSSILLILMSTSLFAQKLKDRFEYKVTYNLTFNLDSTATEDPKSEYMILYTGDELSKFSSRAVTLSQQYEIKGNSGQTPRQAVTKFHYRILKEREAGELYYTLKIPGMDDRFYFVEDLDQFEWEILTETKMIKEYQVQKATTSFAGRDYVAWFTPEIPIPDGPYKFNGLPGLILEIADTKAHYFFDFVGLEKLTPNEKFNVNLRQYAKTNRKELQELWYRYRRDPMTYANNPNVKIDPEVHKKYVESFTKMLEKENNPIELE